MIVWWCSPLAAGTEKQQYGDQQQDSEGTEGDDQDHLPTAHPWRITSSSCRTWPNNTRFRPPPHSTQHWSHGTSHCGGRGHRTGTSCGNERKTNPRHIKMFKWNEGQVISSWTERKMEIKALNSANNSPKTTSVVRLNNHIVLWITYFILYL